MNDEQSDDERTVASEIQPARPGKAATPPPSIDPPRNIAPRPHWISICLGFLSPAAAIVALYLSAQSLETSRMSIRVAQRAYLVLRNGQIRRSEIVPILVADGAPTSRDETPVLFQWGLEIHNLGQTPASAIEYALRFKMPSGWSLLPFGDEMPVFDGMFVHTATVSDNTRLGVASDVAQNSYVGHLHTARFRLTDEAIERWRSVHTDETLQVDGVLTYRDVFNEEHKLTWCWAENPAAAPRASNEDERYLGVRPAIECQSSLRTVLKRTFQRER